MDFQLNDEQKELQETARKFARAELMDLSREMEEKGIPLPESKRRRYAGMGFLGVNLPELYGGLGLGAFGGALAPLKMEDLGTIVLKALADRTGIDPGRIDDVIFGEAG